MNSDPNKNPRRSIRLKDYDYSQPGAYFVTLVTIGRACVLGEIRNESVVLSNLGNMVSALWQALPAHFSISLGEWAVMPNHLHGIVILEENDRSKGEASGDKILVLQTNSLPVTSPLRAVTSPPNNHPNGTGSGSLGAILQNFKSITTRRANQLQGTADQSFWQRNYYEHVIRDEKDWDTIHRYIVSNPIHWEEDENR